MPPATTDHAPLTVVLVHGTFAGASSTEAEGSHAIMVSQPGAAADVILTAAAAVARPAAATGG